MEKSLSERIAAKAMSLSQSDENQNRAVFLALRSEIKQALDDGWPITIIWKTLHEEGKVTFGYDAFRRYTKHLIPLPHIQNQKKPEPPPTPKTAPPKKSEPFEIGGFTFNPTPKKEDLF